MAVIDILKMPRSEQKCLYSDKLLADPEGGSIATWHIVRVTVQAVMCPSIGEYIILCDKYLWNHHLITVYLALIFSYSL